MEFFCKYERLIMTFAINQASLPRNGDNKHRPMRTQDTKYEPINRQNCWLANSHAISVSWHSNSRDYLP
jgi:hypothetical protein